VTANIAIADSLKALDFNRPNREEPFSLYLELGSMGALIAELDRRGIGTKVNGRRDGRQSGGTRFGVGPLAHLLKNAAEATYNLVSRRICQPLRNHHRRPMSSNRASAPKPVSVAKPVRGMCLKGATGIAKTVQASKTVIGRDQTRRCSVYHNRGC